MAVLESMFLEKGVQSGVPGHGRGKHQQTGDSSNIFKIVDLIIRGRFEKRKGY